MKDIYNRKEAAKLVGISQRAILRTIQACQFDAINIVDKTCYYTTSHTAVAEYAQRRGRV
ncbi:hypothetical protein AMQ83_09975 [Paenibacillus riograndensis]|nr:hypothetical protein AMQ83_09975 [Paenibacillus riograndensis]